MRAVNAATLVDVLSAQPFSLPPTQPTWFPVIDGITITQDPSIPLHPDSRSNLVPVIAGIDTDDLSIFIYHLFPSPIPAQRFAEYVQQFPLFHNDTGLINQALHLYPADPGDNRPILSAMLTDVLLLCPLRRQVSIATQSDTPSFLYRFAHSTACSIYASYLGVTQTAQLPYVFGNVFPGCQFTEDEMRLSNSIQQYWISFAANFTPISIGNLQWPVFGDDDERNIVFNVPISIQQDLGLTVCEFWDPLLSPQSSALPHWVVPVVATFSSVIGVIIICYTVVKCIERRVQQRNQSMLTQSLLQAHKPYSGWQLRLSRTNSEMQIML